jgi:hypothetical protein
MEGKKQKRRVPNSSNILSTYFSAHKHLIPFPQHQLSVSPPSNSVRSLRQSGIRGPVPPVLYSCACTAVLRASTGTSTLILPYQSQPVKPANLWGNGLCQQVWSTWWYQVEGVLWLPPAACGAAQRLNLLGLDRVSPPNSLLRTSTA